MQVLHLWESGMVLEKTEHQRQQDERSIHHFLSFQLHEQNDYYSTLLEVLI
jgi:hypothetical protein